MRGARKIDTRSGVGFSLVCACLVLSPVAASSGEHIGTVTGVIDACHLQVKIGDKDEVVRLLGVSAPLESAFLTRALVKGKRVTLRSDSEKDSVSSDGALLRYVFFGEGVLLNSEIIRLGYARADRERAFTRLEEFKVIETEAAHKPIGLWTWGDGDFAPLPTSDGTSNAPRQEAQSSEKSRSYYAGKDGVTNPVLTFKVPPKYPAASRKARIQGKVVLQAKILKDGTVHDVQVLESADPKGLDKAAVDAVKQWKYKPGLLNGQPVDVYFTVVVTFSLS